MEIMLAACNRGGVAVAEGLEADAAGVVAGVLHAALHERRRGGELLHLRRLLVHPALHPSLFPNPTKNRVDQRSRRPHNPLSDRLDPREKRAREKERF
jgi:hypothetical protein